MAHHDGHDNLGLVQLLGPVVILVPKPAILIL